MVFIRVSFILIHALANENRVSFLGFFKFALNSWKSLGNLTCHAVDKDCIVIRTSSPSDLGAAIVDRHSAGVAFNPDVKK